MLTRPDGTEIELAVNPATGRLETIASPNGVPAVAMGFTYFANNTASPGKVQSITATGGVTQAFAYAGALLTSVVWNGPVTGTLTYSHDDLFRAKSETVDGTAPIDRLWNLDGQLTHTGDLQLAYDAVTGLFQGTTLGVVSDSVTWSGFGEASSYTASIAGTALWTRTFERDALGRITTVTETLAGSAPIEWTYDYDLAGHLTDVWQNGVRIAHDEYDAHGNRTLVERAGEPPIVATYDAQDRIEGFGATTVAHTQNGERLTKTSASGTTTYTHDAFGQLRSVTLPDATLIEYLYDAAGRRITKQVDGAFIQRFLYGEMFGPAALVDANGAVIERYVYATSPSVPDYVLKLTGPWAGVYRLIKDERGSVRLVVNAQTGAIAQALTYDAHGRVLSDTHPGFVPFGFGGGLWDADTGLVRFGLRDYDPEIGRWITQDPIGLAGGDTNLYAYVAGDPINATDPTGLFLQSNPAMDSALNGGLLSWLGFEQFARGAFNYNEGLLKLSNDATFNEGLAQIRQGICQMVGGGVSLATNTGPMAIGVAGLAGAVIQMGLPSSRMLGRAMAKAGQTRPKGHAAHHIVAKKAPGAADARQILEKFGIGLDDAVNGVFLPASSSAASGAANHTSLHTAAYYRAVNYALSQATSRADALGILAGIANKLQNGGFREHAEDHKGLCH